MNRSTCIAIVCTAALSQAACAFLEKPKEFVPTELVSAHASGNAKRLVIVLPGRGDDLAVLKKFSVAPTIQQGFPDADVLLVEMTLPYYMEGRSMQRLHEQVVLPARQRGYEQIFLAGASMGGMGVLMYEHEHPNEMNGLVLMAPYMGDGEVIQEIKTAGGLAQWNAGPLPEQINRDNVPREEWRVVQSWLRNPQRAAHVWLICGQDDRLHAAASLVADTIPREHVIEPEGGHAWKVWNAGARSVWPHLATP